MREDICIHIMSLKVLSCASVKRAFVYASRRPPPDTGANFCMHLNERAWLGIHFD